MINKHENISICVYLDDISIAGWKLSGWLNTRAKISPKICEKYSLSTLGVAWYLRSYWDRWADAGCCVSLRVPAQEQLWKSKGSMLWRTNITTEIFPWISKTVMCKPVNEECLLYCLSAKDDTASSSRQSEPRVSTHLVAKVSDVIMVTVVII
jgi:hypothetical protein